MAKAKKPLVDVPGRTSVRPLTLEINPDPGAINTAELQIAASAPRQAPPHNTGALATPAKTGPK